MADHGDGQVLGRIKKLVEEEEVLWGEANPPADRAKRLEAIRVELDQCWDLLRQRRALREFGNDPERAKVRPPEIVEKYKQ